MASGKFQFSIFKVHTAVVEIKSIHIFFYEIFWPILDLKIKNFISPYLIRSFGNSVCCYIAFWRKNTTYDVTKVILVILKLLKVIFVYYFSLKKRSYFRCWLLDNLPISFKNMPAPHFGNFSPIFALRSWFFARLHKLQNAYIPMH